MNFKFFLHKSWTEWKLFICLVRIGFSCSQNQFIYMWKRVLKLLSLINFTNYPIYTCVCWVLFTFALWILSLLLFTLTMFKFFFFLPSIFKPIFSTFYFLSFWLLQYANKTIWTYIIFIMIQVFIKLVKKHKNMIISLCLKKRLIR